MKNNIQKNYYSKTLKVFLQQLPNEKIVDGDKSAELEQIKNPSSQLVNQCKDVIKLFKDIKND